MKSLFYWIITVVLVAAAAAFTAFNQHSASLDLWPLDFRFSLPVYLIVLAALACGFLLGAFAIFILSAGERSQRRDALYRNEMLERENAKLRESAQSTPAKESKGKSLLAPR